MPLLLLLLMAIATTQAVSAGATIDASPRDEPWWIARHAQKLAELRAHPPDIILLGDSIVQELERRSLRPEQDMGAVWDRYFGPCHAANLGFAGDKTSNLLWRIRNGEVAGIAPRWAVLLIGTNDQSPPQNYGAGYTVAAIATIVYELRQRLPTTRILLLALLPRGFSNDSVLAVNQRLAAAPWATVGVVYLDVGGLLLRDGMPDSSLFLDPLLDPPRPPLHPNPKGWARLAAAIAPHFGACGRVSGGD